MKPRARQAGFTLVEVIVTVLITSIVVVISAASLSQLIKFFHASSVRQQLQSDADNAMATMKNALQRAHAGSVRICSCATDPCQTATGSDTGCWNKHTSAGTSDGTPPNSRIEFTTIDGPTINAFYWNNGALYKLVGGGDPQMLANNVTGVLFSGDATDFTHLYISLRLDAPSGPNQFATVYMDRQIVALVH